MSEADFNPFEPRQIAGAETPPAPADHNERSQYEEQQFLRGFREIQDHKSDIGSTMAEINAIYKHLKGLGFTKQDVKWAMELEEKAAPEIIATMQRRVRIAKMLGHGVARQMEIFDKDRTPIEDRAYEEGLAAGKLRKQMNCPFDVGSPAGQAWLRGVSDGNSFINQDLASAMEDQQEAA